MASYHLDVSTVSRGRGQSAVAGAAYRAGETLHCEREGVTHDYSRKGGVEVAFVLAPDGAPSWASERNALWNAAEAAEGRKNSVVAREWRLALPYELSSERRVALAEGFGKELVARYGVAVDVAVHAPHREGDDRNWHAHLLTTTRELGSDGFGAKTRVLDAAKTGSVEILAMRAVWAEAQNQAYREAGIDVSVDHRSLEAQREEALERGDEVAAKLLERVPEPRMGVAATNMERKAKREAIAEGREYEPVTERGRAMERIRDLRGVLFAALKRVDIALEGVKAIGDRVAGGVSAYDVAREAGEGRFAAMRSALQVARDGLEQDRAEKAPERAAEASEAQKGVEGDQTISRHRGALARAREGDGDRVTVEQGREPGRVQEPGAKVESEPAREEDTKPRSNPEYEMGFEMHRQMELERGEKEKRESHAAERNDDDEGKIRVREPQENRIEQEIRDQIIERNNRDRGFER